MTSQGVFRSMPLLVTTCDEAGKDSWQGQVKSLAICNQSVAVEQSPETPPRPGHRLGHASASR